MANLPDAAGHIGVTGEDEPGGFVCGLMLAWVIWRHAHEHTRESATAAGARRMIAAAARQARLSGYGEDNLKQHVWPVYRPVVHLWAASLVRRDAGRGAVDTPAGLREFLGIAEWFRRRGEAIVTLRSSAPLLDPAETWRVPPEVVLPPVELQCDDPDAWDLRVRRRD